MLHGSKSQIEENAQRSQAHLSTYCLMDVTSGAQGTVIGVNLGSRSFFATAAHVIPADHEFRIVTRLRDREVMDFAARHVHASLDVGLLEVLPRDVDRLSETFVPAERLSLRANQTTEYGVFATGYPFKMTHLVQQLPLSADSRLDVFRCDAHTMHSIALRIAEWPSTETPAEVGTDVFISYDPQEEMFLLEPTRSAEVPVKWDLPVPHPAGMSGGGVWRVEALASNSIWRPSAFLHAIQSSCTANLREHSTERPMREGWLRATLIDRWLEVVAANYSDLREKINSIRQR